MDKDMVHFYHQNYWCLKHPEVNCMLPHFLNSDDKFLPYAGNSLDSIVLIILPVTINRFGQSAGNHKFWAKRSLTTGVKGYFFNDMSSLETTRGLSEQWLNWLTGLIEADEIGRAHV